MNHRSTTRFSRPTKESGTPHVEFPPYLSLAHVARCEALASAFIALVSHPITPSEVRAHQVSES